MKAPKKKKLDCKDIENLLHAFLDNELDPHNKHLFEEHLDYCLPCDKKIEFEHKLKRFIQYRGQESNYPASLEKELLRVINDGQTNS